MPPIMPMPRSPRPRAPSLEPTSGRRTKASIACLELIGDIEESSVRPLLRDSTRAVTEGVEEVRLNISSDGGNIFWGLTLHNHLRALRAKVTTVNLGFANSMAAVVYSAGDLRLCAPEAKFILHAPSAYPEPPGGGITESRMRERLQSLHVDSLNLAKAIARASGRAHASVAHDLESRLVLDAREAVRYGLTHEILRRPAPHG